MKLITRFLFRFQKPKFQRWCKCTKRMFPKATWTYTIIRLKNRILKILTRLMAKPQNLMLCLYLVRVECGHSYQKTTLFSLISMLQLVLLVPITQLS
eukprot:UN01539